MTDYLLLLYDKYLFFYNFTAHLDIDYPISFFM